MLKGFGAMELLIVMGILLLMFGAAKLPALGKGLGQGISEFKKGFGGGSKDDDEDEKQKVVSHHPKEPSLNGIGKH